MMRKTEFYIDGEWVAPARPNDCEVINPATEEACAVISLGSEEDVNRAVAAARRAFESFSKTTLEERIRLIERLLEIMHERNEEMAQAVSVEMGAPIKLARGGQAGSGPFHVEGFLQALSQYHFEEDLDSQGEHIVHEPIGVCGLITPWNWPVNQIALKVVPALAVGCTCVLKPSEIAPLSAIVFAEMIDAAGFPKGVFNLVNGEGVVVGEAMSRHPDIDMMSFTGSTRAGAAVSRAAAETVKRVTLELGGKSPNIVFEDADLETAIKKGVFGCMENTGQSCNAPTRMLVQRSVYNDAVRLAGEYAGKVEVGDPTQEGRHIGPLVSEAQFNKVQGLINTAIDEGARLVAGGPGRPDGLNRGYFVRPTVFADVDNGMTIAREEVFGPVLAMIPFDTEEEAIAIANDTPYGLAAYVQTADQAKARRVAKQLRAGMVQINGAQRPAGSPFGGYKQSGNGREGGRWGLEDFLEVKAISGY
ncbi:aldehyde dehydrogenase family protein [Nitratireductor sp. XY-223]|uniref:aldehyde dehydrogenase family protein n=1 Tax=Nitratireductor sp. XY-223 TaxID=2561926 RepID=UPI0010AADEF1|nr:aldehyde dehydrogenase family protein [Nitratireductor sp. XY-223]